MTRTEVKDRYFEYRVRSLPAMLDRARRKVEALENEARRYGMLDLLESGNG